VGGGLETGQHHQAGGLARARRAEHGQKLALGDVEVEVLHDQRFAVIALLDVLVPTQSAISSDFAVVRGAR
jgi:hypothetical protein